jgi:hypothetical protein
MVFFDGRHGQGAGTMVNFSMGDSDWASMQLRTGDVEPVSSRGNMLGSEFQARLGDDDFDDDDYDDDYEDDDDDDFDDDLDDDDLDDDGGYFGGDDDDDFDDEDDDGEEDGELAAWLENLQGKLTFPFEAEIAEHQEGGPLQAGDRVTVLGLDEEVDDLYGILVSCRYLRQSFVFPLADLEVADKDSPNHQPVDDYNVWFASR